MRIMEDLNYRVQNFSRHLIQWNRFFLLWVEQAQLGALMEMNADVPFFEKFFLGGPYNLRGWDYREAGPQDRANQWVEIHTVI